MSKPLSSELVCDNDYIVGIGASAGGLEALQKLLSSLPNDTGFAYLIVQHLSPDYKSLLSEILSKNTSMPVVQVEDGMPIMTNKIYVIQPGKNMCVKNKKILLFSQKEKELNLPIDFLFKSLASECKEKAIAIILSGTGSDGSNGIKDIKENDGLILVQDYESSKFDGMPRSAMRTGIVDAQLTPDQIAQELIHIASSETPKPKMVDNKIDEELMKKIYYILRKVSNINFTHYKQTTIIRRIERRMMLTHKEKLSDYVEYLYEQPEEVLTLSKEVLIGVTSFFRDPELFQILKEKAINQILVSSEADTPIRVWVAGCSTGEEAYSIAISISEAMESLKIKRAVKIFATDLDYDSINTAGKGIYSDSIIDAVSPIRLSKYFTRQNNNYVVNRDIRKMIVFSPHNVFQDPPFGKLDLISCRNMLIYFQPVLQNDLFNIFHSSLKDHGYLFLGKSEAIGGYTDAFPVVDAVGKIFTHRADVRIPGAKNVAFLQTNYLDDDYTGYDSKDIFKASNIEKKTSNEDIIDTHLLEQFMPACIVLNEKNEIIHTYGENSNFLHIAIGKFSNNIFDVITEALKVPVSTILKETREKKHRVQYKNICFNGEHDLSSVNLTSMPIGKIISDKDNLYALVISETKTRGEINEGTIFDIDHISSQRIIDLEQELGEVQGKLNRSVQEQECVNEELQAANEELLTANEELQSSNEELQSVNEELYTVNTEYQQKLGELADLNDDISNFLASTLIGIIFVDNKLNIRRYTDYVTSEFSVMDHDIGRSLKFISYHFPTIDISEICDNVLKTLVPDEREITTSKKKVFFMRVAPYRSTENKILGCVITLVDITKQKQGLVKLQNTEERLNILEELNNANNDYLSRIIHEINNPIIALSQIVNNSKEKVNDPDYLQNQFQKMNNTLSYMNKIIENISHANYSERVFKNQNQILFSLREVLNDVNTTINVEAKKAQLTYTMTIDESFDPKYIGNPTAIKQILINFLSNSCKYTKEGGKFNLKVYEEEQNENIVSLCFVISDNGIGMSKEFIPEMFKPFTRENNTESDKKTNMGLGLSIAYNLIQMMDGNVTVESTPNVGTTFTIHIKLDKDPKNKGKLLSNKMKYRNGELSGAHVLIVEDNDLNRMILGVLLKQEGITYEEASDGEEAIQKFAEKPAYTYDCILMDMRMPKVDGIKATMIIRDSQKEDSETIPIIGVSANGFADDIKQAMNAGLNDYTIKPIDKEKLFDVMSKYITKRSK